MSVIYAILHGIAYVLSFIALAVLMAAAAAILMGKWQRAHSPEDPYRRDAALEWLATLAVVLAMLIATTASVLNGWH